MSRIYAAGPIFPSPRGEGLKGRASEHAGDRFRTVPRGAACGTAPPAVLDFRGMEYEATFAGAGRPPRLTVTEREARRLLTWVDRHRTGKLRLGEGTLTVTGTVDGNSVLARLTNPDQFVALDPPLG